MDLFYMGNKTIQDLLRKQEDGDHGSGKKEERRGKGEQRKIYSPVKTIKLINQEPRLPEKKGNSESVSQRFMGWRLTSGNSRATWWCEC